jgi:ADP-heptose:LPS heptosyltransferase
MYKRLNKRIVLLGGGKNDEQKATELLQNMDATVTSLVGKTTLLESAYVIQQSAGIITSDTGLMHIASAFDIPIHTLWGNTHPALGMYAFRPKNESIYNHIVNLKCQPCSKLGSDQCPRRHFDCMLKQNIEQIVKNC